MDSNNLIGAKTIKKLSTINEIKQNYLFNKKAIPFKDCKFLQKKYFSHPFHNYNVFSVQSDKKYSSLFVTRTVDLNNSKVLLLVDFIGEQKDLLQIGDYLYDMVVNYEYEYVTFLEFGISREIMEKTKFKLLSLDADDIVIPIYFSPLIDKNIIIRFFADNIKENYSIFKADGDQDRPN